MAAVMVVVRVSLFKCTCFDGSQIRPKPKPARTGAGAGAGPASIEH